MTRVNFLAKLAHAQRGEKVVYHTGSLMFDRMIGQQFQTVHAIGVAAWEAYMQGRCLLFQRKIAPLQFEYIAVKQ